MEQELCGILVCQKFKNHCPAPDRSPSEELLNTEQTPDSRAVNTPPVLHRAWPEAELHLLSPREFDSRLAFQLIIFCSHGTDPFASGLSFG